MIFNYLSLDSSTTFDLLSNSASGRYFIMFVFLVSERTEPHYFSEQECNENEEKVVWGYRIVSACTALNYTFTCFFVLFLNTLTRRLINNEPLKIPLH